MVGGCQAETTGLSILNSGRLRSRHPSGQSRFGPCRWLAAHGSLSRHQSSLPYFWTSNLHGKFDLRKASRRNVSRKRHSVEGSRENRNCGTDCGTSTPARPEMSSQKLDGGIFGPKRRSRQAQTMIVTSRCHSLDDRMQCVSRCVVEPSSA